MRLRWIVFSIIVACAAAETITISLEGLQTRTTITIIAISDGITSILIVTVGVLMVLALRKFVDIVIRTPSRQDLNKTWVVC